MTTRLAREEEAANLKLLQEASEAEQLQEEQDSEMVEQQLFGMSFHEVRNAMRDTRVLYSHQLTP